MTVGIAKLKQQNTKGTKNLFQILLNLLMSCKVLNKGQVKGIWASTNEILIYIFVYFLFIAENVCNHLANELKIKRRQLYI